MGEEETRKLLELFQDEQVEYKLYEHAPAYTSLQASKERGVELKSGVKAMLLRTNEGKFALADVAADRRIDFGKIEKLLATRHVRFATGDEVLEVTNCEPGSVHPVGRLFGIDTYLDNSVLENTMVNFNIGMVTKSVQVSSKDLSRILHPKVTADFSKL